MTENDPDTVPSTAPKPPRKKWKPKQDRGIFPKIVYGKEVWFVRCAVNRVMKRVGPFPTKQMAKMGYWKLKSELMFRRQRTTMGDVLVPVPKVEIPNLIGEYVYFIQCGVGGPIKIGYTSHLASRIRSLLSTNGFKTYYLGATPGTREDEEKFHVHYAHLRSHGEWFNLSIEMVTHLRKLGITPHLRTIWPDSPLRA